MYDEKTEEKEETEKVGSGMNKSEVGEGRQEMLQKYERERRTGTRD